LENKTSENIRKHLEMFKKNDKKFVIKVYSQHEIKNSNFEINKNKSSNYFIILSMVLPLLFYSCIVLLLVKQTGLKKFLRRPHTCGVSGGRLRNFFKPSHFRGMTRAFYL
jgi:hypothetical protein